MDEKLFLGKYRVALNEDGSPMVLRQNPAGVTYHGEAIESGEKIALELVDVGKLKGSVRGRLAAEASAARQLANINIPALRDFGFDGDQAVYVTEFFDGPTAGAWVAAHGPMQAAAALRVALQVLGALGAASFHKIVHHAINPQSVIIVPGQTTDGGWPLVKLLNLVGVAPSAAAPAPAGGFDKFASPEQIARGRVDFRSEIYSLGCTLWFLLAGAPPFTTLAEATGPRPMKMVLELERLPNFPKRSKRLLLQMLAIDPEERPHDPLALYENFQDCLAEADRSDPSSKAAPAPMAVAVPAGSVPTLQRARRPVLFPIAAAATIVALLALAAFALPARYRPGHLVAGWGQAKRLGVPVGVNFARPAPITRATIAPVLPPPSAAPVVATGKDVPSPSTATLADSEPDSSSGAQNDARDVAVSDPLPARAFDETPVAAAKPTSAPFDFSNRVAEPEPHAMVAANSLADEADLAAPAEGPERIAPAPDTLSLLPPLESDFGASDPHPRSQQTPKNTVAAKSSARSHSPGHAKTASHKASRKRKRVVKETDTERSRPRSRKETVRARLVGATPDGRWILELPSSRRAIVATPAADKSGTPPRRVRRIIRDSDQDIVPPPLPSYSPGE
ncbi:MAG TPA: protein kinase [Chthoniobacterales bacterium]|nr:protein kinase [Chthoniobacterales bacterium]